MLNPKKMNHMNETGNIFTLRSDRFTFGEYVTYDEIKNYAYKNNMQFAKFGECIRQIESNVLCSMGDKSGDVYETFIHIDSNIYQYCGTLYANADLKRITSFIDANTMIAIKEKAKEVTTNYIIHFSCTARPDFSKLIYVTVLTENTENVHYDIDNCYVQYQKRRKFLKKINFLESLKFDIERTETSEIEQQFKNKVVVDFLTDQIKAYEMCNEKFYF